MMEISKQAALALVLATPFAYGSSIANAEGAKLTHAGPALAGSISKADQQLDFMLNAQGPDSCLALEIAGAAGINSSTERAKYITSGNISLVAKFVAKKDNYPAASACDDDLPVKSANGRIKTTAFTIAADQLPKHSLKRAKEGQSGYQLKHAALSQPDGGVISDKPSHPRKKKVTNALNADVSFGVGNSAASYAQEQISQLPACAKDAASKAIAGAVAQIQGEKFAINGNKMTFAQFQAAFNRDVQQTQTVIRTAANLANVCLPSTVSAPQTVEPAPIPAPAPIPTPTPNPVPTPPNPSEGDPFASGNVGVDVSWANCGATIPASAKFGIVNVNNGIGYSTSPCLTEEASHFPDNALSLYENTAWNNLSPYINPDSPKDCAEGDADCLAYNYGYNAGLYAVNAAIGAGLTVNRDWWLDVEDDATWNQDTQQNRNSIQGNHDALIASGAKRVGIYSTTALWNSITGSWKNGMPSWGATTWDTAQEAMTYCTDHEFTGGKSIMMQFKPNAQSNNLDQNVVC